MKLFFGKTGGFLLSVGVSGHAAGLFFRNKNVPCWGSGEIIEWAASLIHQGLMLGLVKREYFHGMNRNK
jgi:hypothetical protein